MIRVRFHGRGGQGVKTAGRILGTAAFHAGFECQDSPVYGAERRGAAVVAFARISTSPIRERGAMENPDLILVADETLLSDPTAGVLEGQRSASAIFVNASESRGLAERPDIAAPLVTMDLTGRTIAALGRASALSAGIGASAVRLVGVIPIEHLLTAIREEFGGLSMPPEEIERSLELAGGIYQSLPAVCFGEHPGADPDRVVAVPCSDPVAGAPNVYRPGNAAERHTGTWRVERPVIDLARCTRCGLCFVRCPDGAISLDESGYPVIDYDHCKGCMICRQVCPVHLVGAEKETRSW